MTQSQATAGAQREQSADPTLQQQSAAARRLLVGKVINDTANPGRAPKTVVVEVVRRTRDPLYGKYIKRRKRFHAHDEKQEFRTNDVVEIRESRPLSRTKRWTVVRLVERPPEV